LVNGEYPVRFAVDYPDRELDRPVFFAVIWAWFAILFTRRYPRPIVEYVAGVIRWQNRVVGYAVILVTDEYPPFRLRP
jgi:hypothetical protein